jgi:hypothetical protein
MATFTRGDLAPVAFKTANGFFNVTAYNLDHTILLFDVTHTGYAGAGTARIAGKPDCKGLVNYDLDLDFAPFGQKFGILPGTSGLMFWYIGNTNAQSGGTVFGSAIQVPVIVEKLHFETAITSQLKGSIDVSMDLLAAGGTGPTFPTATPALVYPSVA